MAWASRLRAARGERVFEDALPRRAALGGVKSGRARDLGLPGPGHVCAPRPPAAPGGGAGGWSGGETRKREGKRGEGREGTESKKGREGGALKPAVPIHQPARGREEGRLAGRLRRGAELPEGGGVISRRGRGRRGAGVGEWAAWPCGRRGRRVFLAFHVGRGSFWGGGGSCPFALSVSSSPSVCLPLSLASERGSGGRGRRRECMNVTKGSEKYRMIDQRRTREERRVQGTREERRRIRNTRRT